MDYQPARDAAGHGRAVTFTGHWREFLPIAATNLLLIVVTLGVYRFWAAARERRYLWSRTHVIDDTLEWSGTGKEMFLGFLMVVAVLMPLFLFVQFAFPAMVARGHEVAAFLLFLGFYAAFFWLVGLARFRATRYRLSRTWWHGIRGGSDDSGVSFAGEYIGRYFVAGLTAMIAFPWATTRLWNARWNKMSFGPYPFRADLFSEGLWRRWLFIYVAPFLLLTPILLIGGATAVTALEGGGSGPSVTLAAILVGLFALVYLAVPLATLHWYAKFFRMAAASLQLGELEFGFEARTRDWLKLFFGNLALAVVTLGLGMVFWSYRNWSFMVRHVRLYGSVDLSQLTQSQTRAPVESEGFADAFDMGAI